MKYIDKSIGVIPQKLTIEGVEKKQDHINSFSANPARYAIKPKNGGMSFCFDSSIYGHDSVKVELIRIQNKKCCYCESRITHTSYGDIEHIRPKSSYRQGKDMQREYPGYFWLVYDWDNLLFSCQRCNETYKSDLYPLEKPRRRCNNHSGNISNESPLIIDPSNENPQEHITYKNEFIFPKTQKGKVTIKYLGLGREELNEMRRGIFHAIKTAEDNYNIVKGTDFERAIKENFLNLLRDAILNNGQYSRMIEENFVQYIIEL